ncbi:hypothetical protein [Armatimonas rosea]|uniref:FtsP/CotA-like multicopper oxidase with cupredoxin domain n=1 Tax=Armatimonas rosea TaxID=685828 RepID=A0A7W9SKQ9_ARMRO|nr:hypothetical protein [Armatimonas rosea]MBB6048411.1 FtsP/CotA-like multicopper oxidase with cupredoxin domain [Armatimonas rosea]
MKIILKPAGAIIVLAALGALAFMAFRRSGANAGGGSTGDLTASLSGAPLQPLAFPKQPAPGWQLSADGKSLTKADTNNGECLFPEVALTAETGEVQVKVACTELAPNATYPKYGLRVKGSAEGDELDVWIDPQAKVLTTRGRVGGTNYDWHPSPLPDGFDMTKEHTLSIQWSGGGKEWKFLVDDDRHSAQSKHLFAQMKPSSPLVMNYLAKPVYSALAMR